MPRSPYESPHHQKILDTLSEIFLAHPGVAQERRWYGLRRDFPNGIWCDVMCGMDDVLVLRVSRGAWMVHKEPWLAGLFDVCAKVVAKIRLPSVDSITQKALPELIEKAAALPQGLSAIPM